MKYANRILAVAYVLGFLLWGTTIIGDPPSGVGLTWQGAWVFATVIAMAVWLGWRAREEVEQA